MRRWPAAAHGVVVTHLGPAVDWAAQQRVPAARARRAAPPAERERWADTGDSASAGTCLTELRQWRSLRHAVRRDAYLHPYGPGPCP